jgi:hypothetical protein
VKNCTTFGLFAVSLWLWLSVACPAQVLQVGYAANLNQGDSGVNLSNNGAQGGFAGTTPPTIGNICVNVYTFSSSEEELSCCSCLVTPNGLNSYSAVKDLTSNNLTKENPQSIVIKLIASQPGMDPNGAYTLCDPTAVKFTPATAPYTEGAASTGSLAAGLLAWGVTLEPAASPGAFASVMVPFRTGLLSQSELTALTSTCSFIEIDGSGFGICNSCKLDGYSGPGPTQ